AARSRHVRRERSGRALGRQDLPAPLRGVAGSIREKQVADVQIAEGTGARHKGITFQRALPYLLSLPALLVCIGILIPFITAIVYSLQRYNLAFPDARALIWFGNFVALGQDPAFWHTVLVSLEYTALTVAVELLLGLGI